MRMRPMILAVAMFACALCAGPSLAHAESVYVKYRGEVDLKSFDCTDIRRSSYINRVCYDRRNQYMLISLNGTFYHHCEIDAGTVSSLLNAPSMGKFYDASIKGGNFDCRKNRVPEYSQEPDANTLAANPGSAPEVPGCRDAWNDLDARAALGYARILIETDCPVMYRQGWLMNPQRLWSDVIPACVVAWNALVSRGALSSARFLVMHNCPVIERKGWR